MSNANNGEFSFTLREKEDKNGDMYLFAGIHMLNAVIFIRPLPKAPGEEQKWSAVVKPYKNGEQLGEESVPELPTRRKRQ